MQAVSGDTFLQKVLSSGLLSAPQCADLSRDLSADVSPDQVVAYLVERRLLTPFQAAHLASGRTRLVLGQYHILDELGRGGFGCVYKARHTLMDRLVALKVISPGMIENASTRLNFRREVLATTRLTHPNIVMAFDANEVEGVLFFVMEYVDGMNLHQFVRKHGPLAFRLASELLMQVSHGLQYAHEQGLVHRDIKPPNLLIPRLAQARLAGHTGPAAEIGTAPVLVKVVDFGLARLCDSAGAAVTAFQSEHGFRGTPEFVAPEQARNSQAADIRSDLYSLGCTLYFALTGRAPFQGKTPVEIIVQHLEKPAPSVEQHRSETPPLLAGILRRLMAKDPDKRFQTPAELIAEVRFFLGSRGDAVAPDALNVAPAVRDESPPIRQEPAAHVTDMPITNWIPLTDYCVTARPPTAPPTQEQVAEGRNHESEARDQKSGVLSPEPPLDLIQRAPGATDLPLAELWRAWMNSLDARGTNGNEADYRLLHGALLRALNDRAAQSTGECREACQRLITLIQPWLSLETMRQIDEATRADLQARCRQLGQTIGLSNSPWSIHLGVCVIGLMLAPVLLGWAMLSGWSFQVPNLSWHAIDSYVRTHPILSVSIVAPVDLATGLITFSLMRRR